MKKPHKRCPWEERVYLERGHDRIILLNADENCEHFLYATMAGGYFCTYCGGNVSLSELDAQNWKENERT